MNEITHNRTSEYIARQLAEEILSGCIPGGETLTQETLAAQLQTSRIPVREALNILENHGLARRLSTRHMVAAELSDDDIREIFGILCDAEIMAMRNGVPQADMWQPVRFHYAVSDMCGNPYLKKLLSGGTEYYIAYACSLDDTEHQAALLSEILSEQGAARKKRLRVYFNELAELVIDSRRKENGKC